MPKSRGAWPAVALIVLIAVVAASAVGGSLLGHPAPPRLLTDMYGGNGIGNSRTAANTPYTFGGLGLCLDKPGRITIDAVAPFRPSGGLVLQGFVLVPNPFITDGDRFYDADASLTQLRGHSTAHHLNVLPQPHVVTAVCTRTPRGGAADPGDDTLYAQFERTTNAAGDQGLIVEYTSGGERHTVLFFWSVELCDKEKDCPW